MNVKKVTDVDEYLLGFEGEVWNRLQYLRQIIRDALPEADERISYNMPAYFYEGVVVYFAGYKNHIGFYPLPSGIEQFKDSLGLYKLSKGAIQFRHSEDMPYELIGEICKFRLEENIEKSRSGKK